MSRQEDYSSNYFNISVGYQTSRSICYSSISCWIFLAIRDSAILLNAGLRLIVRWFVVTYRFCLVLGTNINSTVFHFFGKYCTMSMAMMMSVRLTLSQCHVVYFVAAWIWIYLSGFCFSGQCVRSLRRFAPFVFIWLVFRL